MLVIRLFRVGKKNQPSFKIVVTDKRRPPRAGRFVEQVGFWNPLTKEKALKPERIKYWLSVGAKPSATIHNMLVSEKIIEAKKIPKHAKSKKKEEPTEKKPSEPSSEKPSEQKTAEEQPPAEATPKEEQPVAELRSSPTIRSARVKEEKPPEEPKKDNI